MVKVKEVIKTTNTRRRGRRRQRRRPAPAMPNNCHFRLVPKLSDCALAYAAALADPFHCQPACIPMGSGQSSLKSKVFARGTLTTSSTTAFGFLLVQPFNLAATTSTAAQRPIRYTDSTYAGAVLQTDSTAVGVLELDSNSPFATTGADSISARLVSAGIRVRYAGTELNCGGTIVCLEDPEHYNMDELGQSDLLAHEQSRSYSVEMGKWSNVTFKPRSTNELQFYNIDMKPDSEAQNMTARSTNAETGVGTPWCLAIAIVSAVVTQPFYFEVYGNFEFIGENVRGKSRTMLDARGATAVREAASEVPSATHTPNLFGHAKMIAAKATDLLLTNSDLVVQMVGGNYGGAAVSLARRLSNMSFQDVGNGVPIASPPRLMAAPAEMGIPLPPPESPAPRERPARPAHQRPSSDWRPTSPAMQGTGHGAPVNHYSETHRPEFKDELRRRV